MPLVIRERVTVVKDGVIEIRHPGLPVGTRADVIVLIDQAADQDRSLVSFLGKGCFADAAEADAFLRVAREGWD